MPIVCPHCSRSLPDSAEPPRFCSYCGQRLRESSEPLAADVTEEYVPPLGIQPDDTPSQIGGFRILKKLGEEATETIVAAKNPDVQRLTEETADLLYHLIVLLVERGVDLGDIQRELKERHAAKSGRS